MESFRRSRLRVQRKDKRIFIKKTNSFRKSFFKIKKTGEDKNVQASIRVRC